VASVPVPLSNVENPMTGLQEGEKRDPARLPNFYENLPDWSSGINSEFLRDI
jgi:hypothetical protein